MKRYLLILMILLPSGLLMAQSLEKKVPEKATYVFCINLSSLSKKINFNDLGRYNFLKKPESEQVLNPNSFVKELFRIPEKAGFNQSGKIFIYSERHDSIENTNYLISLSDAKLFEKRAGEILKTNNKPVSFKKEGKLKVLNHDHKLSIGLFKDYALVSVWNADYYYYDDYSEYDMDRSRVISTIDSIRALRKEEAPEKEPEVAPEPEEPVAPSEESAPVEEAEPVGAGVPSEESADSVAAEVEISADYVVETPVESDYPEDYGNQDYENDSLWKQFERKWKTIRAAREEKFWERKDKKMIAYHKQIADLKPNGSLSSNADFMSIMNQSHDLMYWFNYKMYTSGFIQLMNERRYDYGNQTLTTPEKENQNNGLATFLQNNGMYGIGDFEKGEIKMSFINTFNDTIKPYIEKCYSGPMNADFFKYIKKDNLIGMAGMSVNMEAVANLYYEILRRAYESASSPKKSLIAAIELSDIFLDKQVLYHTFRGDALIACTGIQSNLKTYTTLQYDSTTFEYTSVEKTKNEYLPEFVAVLTIENKVNLNKILNMVVRMDGLTPMGQGLYAFRSRHKEVNDKFFIVIKDNLCFLTNDKKLATEEISGGLDASRTVGDTYNAYLNSSSFGFWDASNMFKLMAEGNSEGMAEPETLKKLGDKLNKGFFVSRPLKGNQGQYDFTLEMKNRENSSLLEFLDLFESVGNIRGFR